ncbi:Glutamate racemase [hydrothermal vent metagenome]|uniref:glutamate racemase n=1 Tax=hydrothermal vent metagenome TaxID=652676 RepID=A0A1W1EHI3_9ZZZZ
MRVGIFDSGVGGFSVVKSLLEEKLFEEIIYYGDTARVPYGTKDENTIIRYSLEAIEFFNNFDIELLITACNTVSAYALPTMRSKSSYPIIGVIEPGVKALENRMLDKSANILITATKSTILSERYQNEIFSLGYSNIKAIQTGLFVPIVEEGLFDGDVVESVMDYYFKDLKQPDAIILGCTHFPLLSDSISNYFDKSPIMIHSGEAIVEYLKDRLEIDNKFQDTNLKIYASDNVEGLRKVAMEWLYTK